MMFAEFVGRATEYAASELMRKSALGIEDGAQIIADILREREVKHLLEIGTYRGITAAYMAGFVEQVTTIDLKDGKMERDGQLFDRVRFWQAMGVGNISLRLVETEAEKAAIIAPLDFDFAFIDGDHSYQGVKADFEKVRHCGAVLFHDYTPGNDVFRFVSHLPGAVRASGIFAFWQS